MAEYFQSDGVDDGKVTRRTVSLRKTKGENFGVELFAVGYQTLVAKVKKFVVIDVTTQQATISCAFRVGLKFGDRLTTINGKPIVCTPELPQTIREWVNVLNASEKLIIEIDNQPFFKNCYLPLNDLWTVPPQNPHNKAVHGLHNVAAVREHAEASGNKANEEHADARLEKKHDPSTTGVDGHEEPDLFAQTLLDIGFECKGDRTISRVVTNSPAFKHQLVVGNVIVQLNDASTSSIEGDRFFIMLKHCLLEERIHIVHCHVTVAREMARGLRIMLEFYKRHKSINEYVNETLALDSLHPYNLAACDDPALNQVSTIEHDVTKLEAKLKKAHFKLQSRLKPAASNSSLNVSKHPSGAVTAPNSPSNTPRGSYALPDNSSDPAIAESQLPPHIQRVTATRSAGPTRRASGSDARWSLSWTHRTTSVQEDAKSQARGSQTHDLQSTRAESKSPETHHRVWSRFFRH